MKTRRELIYVGAPFKAQKAQRFDNMLMAILNKNQSTIEVPNVWQLDGTRLP